MKWTGGRVTHKGEAETLTAEVGNSLTSHLDQWNSMILMLSALQFVVNTNHMKVAGDSIGPHDGHVT